MLGRLHLSLQIVVCLFKKSTFGEQTEFNASRMIINIKMNRLYKYNI